MKNLQRQSITFNAGLYNGVLVDHKANKLSGKEFLLCKGKNVIDLIMSMGPVFLIWP